jgi:hypothetical protein
MPKYLKPHSDEWFAAIPAEDGLYEAAQGFGGGIAHDVEIANVFSRNPSTDELDILPPNGNDHCGLLAFRDPLHRLRPDAGRIAVGQKQNAVAVSRMVVRAIASTNSKWDMQCFRNFSNSLSDMGSTASDNVHNFGGILGSVTCR